jgi:predicted amidohydrolase YtcJ
MTATILINATIHTLDPERPLATALAVADGQIVAVGTDRGVLPYAEALGRGAAEVDVIDLGGRAVLPGLTDAHLHFAFLARQLQAVDVETATRDEALSRVAARAATAAPGTWITGGGWNQNLWDRYPTVADLDRVAPQNPVYLVAKSYHAAWVNSRALQLAGVGRDTGAPAGSEIGRDAAGNLTGVLLEWPAMDLVARSIPRETPEQLATRMKPAFTHVWQAGLTGIHCFDGDEALAAYVHLHQRGELGLRVVKMILKGEHEAAFEQGLRSGMGDDWLRIGNLKVMADGAMGQQTALMFAPYEGRQGGGTASTPADEGCGIAVTGKDELRELALTAVTNGFAMSVHAIGDRANHDVLDVFAQARELETGLAQRSGAGRQASSAAGSGTGIPGTAPSAVPAPTVLRHRIEHVQIIAADDVARLAQLGVIASVQPLHATSDMEVADRVLGARSRRAYVFRELLDTGATLACGSDAPVESCNPFWGIHAAVTRRRVDGAPGPDGWHGDQRLTVAEALHGYTLGAAYAGGHEDVSGSLTPGKLADLVVCDRDIFACDPADIRDTRVLATMVGGVWRHRMAEIS